MSTIDQKIKDATKERDTYLESLEQTIEVCEMVLSHPEVFTHERLEQARKLLKETKENIEKRKAIPFEERI